MGKRDVPDDDWSEEGTKWLESLSIEDLVDLKLLQDHGVDDEDDQKTLDKLRESYEQATGETWD